MIKIKLIPSRPREDIAGNINFRYIMKDTDENIEVASAFDRYCCVMEAIFVLDWKIVLCYSYALHLDLRLYCLISISKPKMQRDSSFGSIIIFKFERLDFSSIFELKVDVYRFFFLKDLPDISFLKPATFFAENFYVYSPSVLFSVCVADILFFRNLKPIWLLGLTLAM